MELVAEGGGMAEAVSKPEVQVEAVASSREFREIIECICRWDVQDSRQGELSVSYV